MVKLWAVFLALGAFVVILDFVIIGDSFPNPLNGNAAQTQLSSKVGNVLTDDGRLAEAGYLTRQRKTYNAGAPQHGWRHKAWDYYGMFLPNNSYFSLAIVDIGILRNLFATYKVGS